MDGKILQKAGVRIKLGHLKGVGVIYIPLVSLNGGYICSVATE